MCFIPQSLRRPQGRKPLGGSSDARRGDGASGEALEMAEDGKRHQAAHQASCSCPTEEGVVHQVQGGMGVRPHGFLVQNSN